MKESPLARTALLGRKSTETGHADWREFVGLYGPVIYGYARKRGLDDTDAAELMREVFRIINRHAEKWVSHSRCGNLCDWLFHVTCERIDTFLTAQTSHSEVVIERGFSQPHQSVEVDRDWYSLYRGQLAAKAMRRVKERLNPSIWGAFQKTTVEGLATRDVGFQLQMSPGEVHVARCVALSRLREEMQRIQTEMEACTGAR